jgi:hypothetical protein
MTAMHILTMIHARAVLTLSLRIQIARSVVCLQAMLRGRGPLGEEDSRSAKLLTHP